MRVIELPDVSLLALLIELVGSLIIIGYVLAAILALLRREGVRRTRMLVAEGALMGLSFKVAAALLKTLVVRTWTQIAIFAIILALRTLLKRVFAWEETRLESSGPE